MQTLLNLYSKGEYGVLRSPNWPYVRDGLKRNLSTVIRYYRRNPTAVKAQHFLVRLLQSITVPHSLPIDRYYANVDALALNISMALKMTSPIFKGEIFEGVFYGRNSTEVLIASDEVFDPVKANTNWRNLCPVRVLQHFRTDIELNIPDGTAFGTESGTAVFSINIPMLAIQYRAFRLEQIKLTADTDEAQLTVQQFIRMYVLPNMLFSHLDVALFNRLVAVKENKPIAEGVKSHPFFVADYDDRVDFVLASVLNYLSIKEQEFAGMLKTIPAVTKENMFEVMTLPNLAPTRQVAWGLVLAELPVALFLHRMSHGFRHARNRTEVNYIQRAAQAFKSDSTLRSALPPRLFNQVASELRTIDVSI